MSIAAHWPALQVVLPLLVAPMVMLLRGTTLPWLTARATSFMAFAIAISMASTVLQGKVIVYEMGSWPAASTVIRENPPQGLLDLAT